MFIHSLIKKILKLNYFPFYIIQFLYKIHIHVKTKRIIYELFEVIIIKNFEYIYIYIHIIYIYLLNVRINDTKFAKKII